MRQSVSVQSRVYRDDTLAAYERGVELAITTMRQSFGESLTLNELARVAFMSPFHFSRVFEQITGVSPGRFLAAIRMQEAKRLLLDPDRSVTEISLMVGYNSLGTFSRTFSELVGLPPITFRNALSLRTLPIFDTTSSLSGDREIARDRSLVGYVNSCEMLDLIAVGLFPSAIPKCFPLECNVLCGTNRFAFSTIAPSASTILAVGMLRDATLEDAILALPDRILVGCKAFEPVANQFQEINVELRPPVLTDPPIVFAFALLMARSRDSHEVSNLGEAFARDVDHIARLSARSAP